MTTEPLTNNRLAMLPAVIERNEFVGGGNGLAHRLEVLERQFQELQGSVSTSGENGTAVNQPLARPAGPAKVEQVVQERIRRIAD